jgi:histidinol-phosphate aminotransferase
MLKIGAFASAASFLSLAANPYSAYAQNQTAKGVSTDKIIRLWGNENPYGPSPKARQAIIDAALAGNRYASSEINTIEKMIAEREGVAPESVILGTGSGEVLAMAAMAFGLDKGEIVTPDPTFFWLMRYAEFIGAKINRVPLDQNRAHDLKAMRERVGSNTKLVYVCNPNNPTATIVPSHQLRQFCEDVSKQTPVLVDEAYLEYLNDFPASSMIDLVRKGQNVMVLRTFSKIYGLAGLRLGYGLAKPEIANRLKQFRMTWLNPVSLRAGIASLEDTDFVRESRRKNAETRRFVLAEMDKLKLAYAPNPQGNFFWLNVGANRREAPVALAKSNIYVAGLNPRPLDSDSMRVTIGTMEEMQAFVRAMQAIVKG